MENLYSTWLHLTTDYFIIYEKGINLLIVCLIRIFAMSKTKNQCGIVSYKVVSKYCYFFFFTKCIQILPKKITCKCCNWTRRRFTMISNVYYQFLIKEAQIAQNTVFYIFMCVMFYLTMHSTHFTYSYMACVCNFPKIVQFHFYNL